MPIEMAGLLSSLKAVTDLTKSAIDLRSEADVRARIIDIQSALLDAQTNAMEAQAAQSQLLIKVAELEAELASIEAWKLDKTRYGLVCPFKGGSVAYALKQRSSEGEEPHLLCTNCFENSQRSFLQGVKKDNGFILMVCNQCGESFDTGYRGIGRPKYYEAYQEADKDTN